MKKATTYILIGMLLLPVHGWTKAVYSASTRVEKSFATNSGSKLSINSRFSSITISTWDKNEVAVSVTIAGSSTESQRDAERQCARITISATETNNSINLQTLIASSKSKSNGSYSVSYEVKVPPNIAMSIANEYGNVSIDECGGSASILVQYGSFSCQAFKHALSSLVVHYGQASIKSASNLKAELKYSPLKVDHAENMEVAAEGSEITIGTIGKRLKISNKYSETKVKNVLPSAESLSFTLQFGDLWLNISPAISYTVEAISTFGNVSLPKNTPVNLTRLETSHKNTDYVKGTVGKGTPTLSVKISNEYASNTLTAN